ncbi:hypothetical protein GF312_04380 [Candidatus Poribacteria bacterium]|nr:hypothetical protein [Candidatus Poribacteria bacterium]
MKKKRRETLIFIGFMLIILGLGQLIGVFFPGKGTSYLAKYGGDTNQSKLSSEEEINIRNIFIFTSLALTIPGIILIIISWPRHK